MKNLIKKLALNEDGVELAYNYMNEGFKSPLILELEKHYPEVAELVCRATDDSDIRSSELFREKIKSNLIPLLPPLVSLENSHEFFLQRALDNREYPFFSSLIENEEFNIPNKFMAFYLNGLSAGGLVDGCNISLICESVYNAKLLGCLSQVPTENEVLIPEGCLYKVCGIFEIASDLLNSGLLTKSTTIKYFEEYRRAYGHRGSSFILIEAIL